MFLSKVDVPVGVTPEGLCVYWRPGETLVWETLGCGQVPSESDINKTTCECNHLTTFASLMDPYGSTVSEFQTPYVWGTTRANGACGNWSLHSVAQG